MYIYEVPSGLTALEIEEEIKLMQLKILRHEAKAAGLRECITELKEAIIRTRFNELKIKNGDDCIIKFSDGKQRVVLNNVKYGGFYVCFYGSKGKPNKTECRLNYTDVKFVEKAKNN